jgi:hypothetical protein
MIYDLSRGDSIHIGDAVTLTMVAVEGNLVHFWLESPDRERPDPGPDCQHADLTQSWWELN